MHGNTQGNSLRSYLYLKLEKYHISSFILYVFLLQNWVTGGQNRLCGVWEGGSVGDRGRGMNTVQTMYTHDRKC
jgi:hypothetical protein